MFGDVTWWSIWVEFGASFLSPNGEALRLYALNPWEILVLLVPMVYLRRRGKSAGYLLCFALFFAYTWAVVDIVVCPLPFTKQYFQPFTGILDWSRSVNLIPGASLRTLDGTFIFDFQAEGNLLLGVPFGCLLPLLRPMRARRFVPIAFLFGASLELTQLFFSLIYGAPYRSIDIDDTLLAFLGALLGYALLRLAALLYHLLYRRGLRGGARIPVWEHFHKVMLSLSPPRTEEKAP